MSLESLRAFPHRFSDWVRTLVKAVAHQPIARRRLVIVLAAFLVCGYALGVLGYVLAIPEIGIRCAFTPVVNHFYPEFLYPESQERPREGDVVKQVGAHPVTNWSQFLRALLRLPHEQPDPFDGTAEDLLPTKDYTTPNVSHVVVEGHKLVRVLYQRGGEGGEIRTVWCRLGHSPVETLLPSLLWFFLKIGLFAVGALVFWKRPDDRSAAQFFVLCVVSLGAYIGGYQWVRIVTQPVLLLPFMVCAVLLPAVSLHFYLIFPRPKQFLDRWPRRVFLAIYGPALGFLIFLIGDYLRLRWWANGGGAGDAAPQLVHGLLLEMLYGIYGYFGVAVLWYLASIVCLLHSFRTAGDATEHNQVKWILYGQMAAMVPISYSLYLAFLEQGRFGGGGATWPMFAASACVTLAYTISITRYRLMELDQIVSSGAIYFLFSSVAGLVYYGLVFTAMLLVGTRVGEGPSLGQALVIGATALVLMLTLDLLRGRVKTAMDRHFRRDKYQLDRLFLRIRQAIGQLVDPPTVARQLLHTSAELLGAARGAVYLRQGDPPLYFLSESVGPASSVTELPPGCPLVERLIAQGVVEARPRAAVDDPARRQLRFLGGEVAHAFLHEGHMLGLLVLGPKETGPYTPEDVNLLTAFTQLTVLALVSAEGHRTIAALNRDLQGKVDKIAEQQRRILSLQTQLNRGVRADGTTAGVEVALARAERFVSAAPAVLASPADGIVGSSPVVQGLMHLVRKVAASESVVLLRGESGTGKELLARAVHEHSPRGDKKFIQVHCAALSASLLESELFGHVKGAFTNAIRDKVGRFEAAHGGTLFLDEIGDITLDVQTKLLRVLQEKSIERVGSSEPLKVDVRIIAATHQDLEELMRQGRFREDLFYRLNVFPIQVPPLRERVEDVAELAMHFLRLHGQNAGKNVTGIDDDALARLKAYPWPGNVRQLENVIQRAVVIAESETISVRELPDEVLAVTEAEGLMASADREDDLPPWSPFHPELPDGGVVKAERLERERRERETIVRALAATGGNKAEAARALGMARSTLVSRLKRLGLG